MKTMLKGFVCASAVLAAVMISGCASSGQSKASSTTKGLEAAATEVEEITTQTAVTLAALSNLVYHPAPDLRSQYKEFDSATKKLGSLSHSVDKKSDQVKARAAAYFEEWDRGATEISNEDLRAISERRRTDVSGSFDETVESLKKSKGAFDPFLSDLKDIQQVLSLDLTQGGIKSVLNIAEDATIHGVTLEESLAESAEHIRKLASKMSSAGPEAEEVEDDES